ncbi:MAG: DUF2085 domain-containing protein [Omnitrophica WOR_2 bacterium]
MITVKLYSRKDCSLCDQAKEDLTALQKLTPHRLEIIDVDGDQKLQRLYGSQVPVVEVGPYRLKAPFDKQELQITLGAAALGIEQDRSIEQTRGQQHGSYWYTWTKADGISYWLSNHYLALINLLVFIYVGLPILAPVLMKTGATGPAYLIYKGYGAVCHQMAFRSWFLFGEQTAYPREAAGVKGLIPYDKATGLSDQDILAARQFIGNPQIGYKVAFCERDVAIYASILMFGLFYATSRRKIPALPWYLWVLIGIIPIALDGGIQLLSQPPFSLMAYHESTPLLRALTGGLFGFTTAWFGYPMIEDTMIETKKFLGEKLDRLRDLKTPAAAHNG